MMTHCRNTPANAPLDIPWALQEAERFEAAGDFETAANIHAVVEMERAEVARQRAAAMDTSWVRPILSGFSGESALDD